MDTKPIPEGTSTKPIFSFPRLIMFRLDFCQFRWDFLNPLLVNWPGVVGQGIAKSAMYVYSSRIYSLTIYLAYLNLV